MRDISFEYSLATEGGGNAVKQELNHTPALNTSLIDANARSSLS